jgi:dTDP-glucose pyrophosphorylase
MKTLVLSGSRGSRLRPLKIMDGKQPIPAAKQTISEYPLEQAVSTIIRKVGVITVSLTGQYVKSCPKLERTTPRGHSRKRIVKYQHEILS